ncbi:MAG: cytochrome c, partial [Bryobacteraceae bacterium]
MSRKKIFWALALLLAGATAARADEPAGTADTGEYVARAGDCVSCHSVPGGKAFAGGLKMGSPVGTIYTTNITPDKETG